MTLYRMPSLGADMEAGTLVEWIKQPGDAIKRGDVVAVVETQKGAIEIESFEDATLTRQLVTPGTKVPVGTPLAEFNGGGAIAEEARPRQASPAAPLPPMTRPGAPRRAMGASDVPASPAARKLAADAGIELSGISGSGPDGAVVFVDVERAIKSRAAGPTEPSPAARESAGPDRSEMRKAIAAAMARSKREIPHYYLSHDVDLTPALDWLARANATRPPTDRLLLGAVYIRSVAQALRTMPEFNGFYVDGAFRPASGIHVGMAISLRGGGLVAPAIHHADALSLDQIMGKLRDLVARIRAGRMRGSELSDPTITVSSLGDRGVDTLYGVIQPPQVALVGFGTPRRRPWLVGEGVAPRMVVTATLAADHRVGDGHRGALFLARIGELLQAPESS